MAISGTQSTIRGSILGAGNTSSENSVSLGTKNTKTIIALSQKTVIQSAFKATAVTITSVGDSSGVCVFTLNSHGLSVGNYLQISGATAPSLNRVHKITAKDTNTFTTNVVYVASATAGTYQLATRNLGILSAGNYVGPYILSTIAGTADTSFDKPASSGLEKAIMFLESSRRLNITSWNYATGVATKGSNAGASYSHGTDDAARPSRAIPGELVILEGNIIPTYKDYSAKTG